MELENYVMKLQIEARVLGDMVTNQVLPAVMDYQGDLLANIQGFMDVYGDSEAENMTRAQRGILEELSAGLVRDIRGPGVAARGAFQNQRWMICTRKPKAMPALSGP